MSQRESITTALVNEIKQIRDPKPVFVTRENTEIDDLANSQFPCVIVRSINETREYLIQTGSQRQGVITYELLCFFKGKNTDQQINDLLESIDTALDSNRNLNGTCNVCRVTIVNVNTTREQPYGEASIELEAQYIFRGV